MGRLLGNLKDLPGHAARRRSRSRPPSSAAGVDPEQVQYVIMGQVLQAGAGQIPARQAAVGGGHPDVRARR